MLTKGVHQLESLSDNKKSTFYSGHFLAMVDHRVCHLMMAISSGQVMDVSVDSGDLNEDKLELIRDWWYSVNYGDAKFQLNETIVL